MKDMAKTADRIAQEIGVNRAEGQGVPTWTEIRDYCDICTTSDLDRTPLDILTDMVQARLGGGID